MPSSGRPLGLALLPLALLAGEAGAVLPSNIGRAALLQPTTSSCIGQHARDITRRAAILAASVPVIAASAMLFWPDNAGASYAMQMAASTNVPFEKRQATPKEMERAVYEEIEASIEQKRAGRPDEGTLGYVGGEYTKRSAHKRLEYDESQRDGDYLNKREKVLSAMLDSM